MGLFSSVIGGLGKALGGWSGAINSAIGIGSSLYGKSVDAGYAMDAQQQSQAWNEYMYKNRYQMTVEDLEAAGLNPILAAKGGLVGSSPSSGIAGIPPLQNAYVTSAQVAKLKADKKLVEAQEDLTSAQATQAHIVKRRKLKEEGVVDKGDWIPLLESLPNWMRGLGRFGIGTGRKVWDYVKPLRNKTKGMKPIMNLSKPNRKPKKTYKVKFPPLSSVWKKKRKKGSPKRSRTKSYRQYMKSY